MTTAQSKTKQLTESKAKELAMWQEQVKSDDEAIRIGNKFSKFLSADFDPDKILMKYARELVPKLHITSEKLTDKDNELLNKVGYALAIEHGISTIDAVEERYRGMILKLRRELVKEYECTTYSEMALVDLMVGAYARNLTISKRLVSTATMDHTSPNLNQFMAVMSKEIDRANRQFITALETIKQIKQPNLNVQVNTLAAFIAQNQQLNNNPTSHETIEPK